MAWFPNVGPIYRRKYTVSITNIINDVKEPTRLVSKSVKSIKCCYLMDCTSRRENLSLLKFGLVIIINLIDTSVILHGHEDSWSDV